MMRESNDAPRVTPPVSTQGDGRFDLDHDGDVDFGDAAHALGGPRRMFHRFVAWRDRVRGTRAYWIYRVGVGLVGLTISVVGLALVPLPGPGWVIVFIGLAILASEFESAARLQHFAKRTLDAWTAWLLRQALWVKGLCGLATAALLACLAWAGFAYYGVPDFVPEAWIPPLPGLE